MAAEIKLSITCDRCKRIEMRDAPDASSTARATQFKATLTTSNGKAHEYSFVDLCGPCENTVSNLLGSIAKKVEKKSPDRKAAKKS